MWVRYWSVSYTHLPVDDLYEETIEIPADAKVVSVEFLPGQCDQRADAAVQCVKFLKEDEEPVIRTAVTYMIEGQVSDEEFSKIKSYCINPVDSRETGMEKPDTLITVYDDPADVAVFDGFRDMDESSLKALYESLGLAMTFKDFLHIQKYFHEMCIRDSRLAVFIILSQFIEQRSIKIKKIVAGFPEIEGTDLLQIVELFLQALVSTAEVQTSLTQHTKGQIRLLYQDPVIVDVYKRQTRWRPWNRPSGMERLLQRLMCSSCRTEP